MAIINMGFYRDGDKLIEGAYSPIDGYLIKGEKPGYFIYETYIGCCIKDEERNGYDDSDWSMLVWDEETQSAKWDHYATTRAWCYPCYGSRVDATPEVLNKYHEWEAARLLKWQREDKFKTLQRKRQDNAEDRQIARFYGVQVARVRSLRGMYHPDTVKALHKLLEANLRSEFRKSLKKQLISWLEEKTNFAKPFSPKQIAYI